MSVILCYTKTARVWQKWMRYMRRNMPVHDKTWRVYDKDHMSALRIKNTSESDPEILRFGNKIKATFKQYYRQSHFRYSIHLKCLKLLTAVHKWLGKILPFFWSDEGLTLEASAKISNPSWCLRYPHQLSVIVDRIQFKTCVLHCFLLAVYLTSFMPSECALWYGLDVEGKLQPDRLSGEKFCCISCAYKHLVKRTWTQLTIIFTELSGKHYRKTISWIRCTIRTDTQGYRAGLADTKLSPYHILWYKNLSAHISIDHNDSLSLTCTLYTRILTYTGTTHIYNNPNQYNNNNHTSTLDHLVWEFKKPFIISFIRRHFIPTKINELLLFQYWRPTSARDVFKSWYWHLRTNYF